MDLERWLNRQLVGTTPRRTFRLIIVPHIIDITGSSLLALNLRFRYGMTSKLMGGFRLRFYTDNPFTNDERSDPGIGDIIFETKYRLPTWRAQHLETAISLKVLVPLTDNENRSDGVVHIAPGITFLRPVLRWPPLHIYVRAGFDIATEKIVRTPVADEIQETFFLSALGLVYPTASALFFYDVEWQTNVFVSGGGRHNILITPGVRYELPKMSWLPGLWNIEVGLRIGLVDTLNRYDLGFRLTLDIPKRQPLPLGGPFFHTPTHISPRRAHMAQHR